MDILVRGMTPDSHSRGSEFSPQSHLCVDFVIQKTKPLHLLHTKLRKYEEQSAAHSSEMAAPTCAVLVQCAIMLL